MCSASFISTTKPWHGMAWHFKMKVQNFLFLFFFFFFADIIQSIAVALAEFVLDAIYPCRFHAGHSRVCASLIDQEVAVLFDFPLLLDPCQETNERAKPSHNLPLSMAEFAVLISSPLIMPRIVLWLTKLNRKCFRDQWHRISPGGYLAFYY